MRNYRIITMLAVAATMFFSCQKVQENKEEAIPDTKEQTVSFNALPMGETKSAFGDPKGGNYPTLWTANDEKVSIIMNLGDGASKKDATVTPSANFETATFAAEFSANGDPNYTFTALSPYTAYLSHGNDRLSFTIPAAQTPIAGSVDETAQILYAKSATLNAFPTESVALHFSHLTAYACMTLTNLELGGATIQSVSITAGKNIAGRWNLIPSDGSYTENSASATITVTTASASNIMFALAPVDLAGKTLKIVVNTDQGTFTKNIASWPSGKVFQAGHVAKFNINMGGIALVEPQVYNLVKDKAELTAGSKVIIAAAGENFAISTTQNGNNRASAAVTKIGEAISDPGDGVEVFTVEAGTIDNTFAFLATKTEGYIYAVSDKNYLRTKADKSDEGSFTVSIAASGVATIGCLSRFLKYNNSNNIFACYASGQQDVAFYKLAGSGAPVVVTPVINVTSDNPMAVSNTASSQTIDYTISNPSGASLTANTDVAWITGIDCSVAGVVSFNVAAQEAAAPARSGVITLSYDGAVDVDVTVNQAAGAGASTTATIVFSSSGVKINGASVNGDDSAGNNWTITTAGTTSYTSNTDYYQVGSSSKPATSITFTTTLPASKNITAFSAKFGGFSGTAGTITLKVGETTVGSGSLNATNDVTVNASSLPANGSVLTVTVTGISKGVKVYNISCTYN